ncbi:MAG: SHOCT domain-containing protein [Leptospira sp.]|nr:SHOCT domain-containing protein [Leptospira sp.]
MDSRLFQLTAFFPVLITLFSINWIGCSTYKKENYKLKHAGSSIAIYETSEEKLKNILPEQIQNQILRFDPLESDLYSLKFVYIKQNIFSTEDWVPIIDEQMIKELTLAYKDILKSSPSNLSSLLFLIKVDDPLSPNTKILRTSFYFLRLRDGGSAIIFREINQNISFPSQYSFEDWTLFQSEKIKPLKKPLILLKPKNKGLRMFVDKSNSKSLVYPNIVLHESSFQAENEFVWRTPMDGDEDLPSAEPTWQSVPEKLKILNQMKADGLITEEEYENKKKKLLQDF